MSAVRWKGGWSGSGSPETSLITYYNGDVVLYENITYAVQSNVLSISIGSSPPPNDMSNWDVLVAGGSDGTSGSSGSSGTSGTSGYSGSSGTSGVNGSSGTSGTSGSSGTSGTSITGSTPTLLQITKTSTQTFPTGGSSRILSWDTASLSQNAGEFNVSSGIFTATKTAKYLVNAVAQMGSAGDTIGVEYSLSIYKNLSVITQGRFFPETNGGVYKPSLSCMCILSVVSGDTITAQIYQNTGGDRYLNTGGTYLTIQQLPSTV